MKNDGYNAFLMVNYETPEFIKELQGQIPEDELYFESDNDICHGIEKETHVTLVPRLADTTDLPELKKKLLKLAKYKVLLSNISVFENEKFDVLKCDVYSDFLHQTNQHIRDCFDTNSEYAEYHPHITIAYLKPGMGSKYANKPLTSLVVLKPTTFHYSYHTTDDKEMNEWFLV